MAQVVVKGAIIVCENGDAPVQLNVDSQTKVSSNAQVATVMDFKPEDNIPSFGTCTSELNPAVQAAESATGVAQAPCTPVITSPWLPGATSILIDNQRALLDSDKLSCAYCPMGISVDKNKSKIKGS